MKEAEIEALVPAGVLQEKNIVQWNAATGDSWPREKTPDEIPMFAMFCERGLALPTSDFFRGFL